MNDITTYFYNLVDAANTGEIVNSVDPAAPSDLGDPLTQGEIDFIKTFKKDVAERFPVLTCTSEKTSLRITDYTYTQLAVEWDNPVDFGSSLLQYKVHTDSTWLDVNVTGNATGFFNHERNKFTFTGGLTPGIIYDIRVLNGCSNGAFSTGITTDTTAPACTDEKTSVGIPHTVAGGFMISWSNPVGYVSTAISYRLTGDTTWLVPNAFGNATGSYAGASAFIFNSGLTVGNSYDVLVQNGCASSVLSTGVIVTATVTSS
jgi:hypothetical protein